MKRPPKFKIAIITWLAIYPLITVTLYFFGPWLMQLPLLLRTLLLTAVLVPAMVYGIVPALQRVFQKWLFSTTENSK